METVKAQIAYAVLREDAAMATTPWTRYRAGREGARVKRALISLGGLPA